MKIVKPYDGFLLITDDKDSVIINQNGAHLSVDVSYNGGCTYMMPKDELKKHWHQYGQWSNKVLCDEAKKLINEVKSKDPFKNLKISFIPAANKKKVK